MLATKKTSNRAWQTIPLALKSKYQLRASGPKLGALDNWFWQPTPKKAGDFGIISEIK